MNLEDCLDDSKDPKLVAEKATNVKLQLVVLCPGFLDFAAENPDKCSTLGKLLLADRTLALLLGVSDGDLTDLHKKSKETASDDGTSVVTIWLQFSRRISNGKD
jgi:hypothetical protein